MAIRKLTFLGTSLGILGPIRTENIVFCSPYDVMHGKCIAACCYWFMKCLLRTVSFSTHRE